MRELINSLATVLLLLCSACSSAVWQDSRDISPISYQISEEHIERSVGRLRRLAIAPVRFKQHVDVWDSYFSSEKRESRRAGREAEKEIALFSKTVNQLTEEKGYEVVPFTLYEDILTEKLKWSTEQVHQHLGVLADWAQTSSDGEESPEDIINIVSKIGHALNVDGLLMIQGFQKPPNVTKTLMLVPFYGVFAIPFMFVEGDAGIRADIYEVSSGRIVWRSSKGGGDRGLFSELENAIPKVLAEKM